MQPVTKASLRWPSHTQKEQSVAASALSVPEAFYESGLRLDAAQVVECLPGTCEV